MTKRNLVAALVGLGLACPGVVFAQDAPVEEQVVNAMNKVFGVHAGFRANHAKGVVVEGKFKPSAEAAGLSRASLFSGAEIPVTVRFSNSTGVPNLPDGSGDANPHGMAVKFHLADGSDMDIVINSLKFFPVSTAAELRDLFLAIADSGPDAAKPTKLEQFVGSHPSVPAALGTIATPDSFADEAYFGVNAFVLVNKAGEKQAVRWQMLPEKVVHLDKAVADSDAVQKTLLFLPGQLTDGVEQSDDPMIDIRNGAYAISFSRRNP